MAGSKKVHTEGFQSIRSFLIIIVVIAGSMLVQMTNSLRVAVLGSGIAGSSAARTLADRGVEVTVFEAGFGVGGRMSTRVSRDESRYQFDHGAQYISAPKTETFRECLENWKSDGLLKEWTGKFATTNGLQVVIESEKKERWVGFPQMNSICSNLLDHENISVKFQTRANASQDKTGKGWNLSHGEHKEDLGTFDWLIVSDRNSGAQHRTDLASANMEEFRSAIRDIQPVKSLTAMVVFDKPLRLEVNGMQFTGKDCLYGSLGWIARDSSKPGRERGDGQECWVLQSHPEAAKKLLKGKDDLNEIREMAKKVLVDDFLKSIPCLIGDKKDFEIPSIVSAVGHRWGAAFPIPTEEFAGMECQVIDSKRFAACGDYFGKLSGRIEGAFLSGRSAANDVLRLNDEL